MYPNDTHPYFGVFVKNFYDSYSAVYKNDNIELLNIVPPKAGGSIINYLRIIPPLVKYRISGKVDVIHCQHAFCVLLAKIFNFRKIVYTNHEGEYFKKSLVEKIKILAIRLSDHVIFVNREMKCALDVELHAKAKSTFLPCPVSVQHFKISKEKNILKSELGFHDDKPLVFFPANPNRNEKNFRFFLDVLEKWDEYTDLVKPNYVCGGNIEYDNMWMYYQACDVVLSCSLFESDGMIYKEALLNNRPFISSDVGNASYYAQLSGMGYIYSSGSIEEFIHKYRLALDCNSDSFDSNHYFSSNLETSVAKLNSILRSV